MKYLMSRTWAMRKAKGRNIWEKNRMDNNMLYEPADIMIYIYGKGIVAKEKSVVAYQKSDGKIVAYGTEAYGMAGNRGEDIVVASPLRRGAVADFPVAMAFFSHLLIKVLGKKPILKPAVAVCAPKGTILVEKKGLKVFWNMPGRSMFCGTECMNCCGAWGFSLECQGIFVLQIKVAYWHR